MEITVLDISGLIPSLQAMRLPKRSKPASTMRKELQAYSVNAEHYESKTVRTEIVGKADLQLASRLIKAGDEHAKAVRGIMVWAEITAPIYWWREMETYRAGRERLSCESTMHMDCKGLTGEQLVQAKAAMPMGKEQTAIDMFSYQCLRRIYQQRKYHRLPHWKQFCEWIESLPFAAELITCGL